MEKWLRLEIPYNQQAMFDNFAMFQKGLVEKLRQNESIQDVEKAFIYGASFSGFFIFNLLKAWKPGIEIEWF